MKIVFVKIEFFFRGEAPVFPTGSVDAFNVRLCTSLTCCGMTIASTVNSFCGSTNQLFDYHTREIYKYILAATDNANGSPRSEKV